MSVTTVRKVGAASALLVSGLLAGSVLAGTVSANAATPTPSASSSTSRAASSDTAVTGAAADKVIAAVKAEDSTVTITTVRKDADGSYDALGTGASGSRVFYDVSADLQTVTAGGGGGHHGGGPGGGASKDTAVTGAAADKVIAAVKAEDSTAMITTVRKDPDGSYDALGTSAGGSKVFYDVSADLQTVTAKS